MSLWINAPIGVNALWYHAPGINAPAHEINVPRIKPPRMKAPETQAIDELYEQNTTMSMIAIFN